MSVIEHESTLDKVPADPRAKGRGPSPAVSARFHLGYRPGLDGIRGAAILLVLLTHAQLIGNGFAFFAVNTFFVLSGFLITCLLLEEFSRTQTISLRRFYLRRALRLLPALITMLAIFVAFVLLVDPRKRAVRELHEALWALFYSTNWASIWGSGRHVSLAHTWSLSVEEQFYIVWPAVLLLLLPRCPRDSLLRWIVLAVFVGTVFRVALFVAGTSSVGENVFSMSPERLRMGTDTRSDSLLLGCVAAVMLESNFLPPRPWFEKYSGIAAALSGAGLLALGWFGWDSAWCICAGWSAGSVFATVLIIHVVMGARSWVHRLLENRLLVYVGQISYGLYVWHYPILIAMHQHQLPWKNLFYLVPVVPITLLCYYLIEMPCLRLKSRFRVID